MKYRIAMQDWTLALLNRIDLIKPDAVAKFGLMNVSQMVCHCTDQIRIIMNELVIPRDNRADIDEIVKAAKEGKSVPTPKGLNQVNGEGTKPTDFEHDKALLKRYLIDFEALPDDFICGEHPYFGVLNKEKWQKLVVYHLNHHLLQFDL